MLVEKVVICFVCVCMFCSNFSDLNLDGEISPAIGDLKSLLSM